MRKVMDIVFAEGNRLGIPVVLDTDAKSKCERDQHLGMELAVEVPFGDFSAMHHLIEYPDGPSCFLLFHLLQGRHLAVEVVFPIAEIEQAAEPEIGQQPGGRFQLGVAHTQNSKGRKEPVPEILQFPANAALVLLLFAHQADTLGKVATVGAGEEAECFQLPEFLIRCAGLIGEPVRSRTAVYRSMHTVGVSRQLSAYENFLRGFRSIFEPDSQNAQKQGGKFGGSRNKIFKQSI